MPQVSFIPFEQARCQNDNFGTVMKEERRQEWEAAMSQKPHTHIDENGNVITHTHDEKHVRHSHYHDPEEKKNCITHAIEDGDMEAVEEFQKAVQKFI